MKKLLLIIIISRGVTAWAQTPAQPWGPIPNPPVIDISRYIQIVENGMDMYERLMGMYQTIKADVEMLEEQRKAFEAFDIKELNMEDLLDSLHKIITYGSRMMTYERNIELILISKDIKIGETLFSLDDLYKVHMATRVTGMANSIMDYAIPDPFEKQLTLAEKTVFLQKYGISYGNYIRNFRIGEGIAKKASEVTAYNKKLLEELAADREAIQSMLEIPGDGSWVKEQQRINGLLMAKSQDLKTKTKLITDIADMCADIAAKAKMETEALQKNFDSDLGENYLKILEKTGNKNDFMGHLYPFN